MSSRLANFVKAHPRLFILTGAGISAGSGIPTYRDQAGTWLGREPIQHQAFISDPIARRRYWARSLVGWPPVSQAQPNDAHTALAELESIGHVTQLVTQNVDRLHQRAGSQRVIDLHGRLDRVRCLSCDANYSRDRIQAFLEAENGSEAGIDASLRPDGDADIDTPGEDFRVPSCERCGGVLMPDVVFFGGNVPRERVRRAMDALATSDALLAVGSSLKVFSGYRFCRRAAELGKPIALLNPGETRADPIASLHLRADCEPALGVLLTQLREPSSAQQSHSRAHPPLPDR